MNIFNPKTDMTWRDFLIRVGLIIVTVGLIVWSLPSDTNNTFKVEKGKPWNYADLRAPFDFPILKTEKAVKEERDSLLKQYEPYFNLNKTVEATQIRQFAKDYNQGIPGISNDYISIIANRLHDIYHKGVMSTTDYALVNKDTTRMIRIVSGKTAVSERISKVYSTVSAYEQLFLDPELDSHREILQKCNLNDYIAPNLSYDKERSEASLSDLNNSIPLASGLCQRGQKIIDRGDIVDNNRRREEDKHELS